MGSFRYSRERGTTMDVWEIVGTPKTISDALGQFTSGAGPSLGTILVRLGVLSQVLDLGIESVLAGRAFSRPFIAPV